MGLTPAPAIGDASGVVTTSLSIDYFGSAKPGAWLEITPRHVHRSNATGIGDAQINADETPVARANATFRVPS